MKHLKRKTVVAVVAVLAIVATAWALKHREGRPEADKEAPVVVEPSAPRVMELAAVDVVEVARGSVERTVPLSGTLRPYEQTLVKSKVAGELLSVLAREGETVRKGQVIARMDDIELRARVAERRAALEATRAQLDLAKKTLAMNEQLFEQNFISRNAADNVASSAAVAEANMQAAAAQLELARKSLADAVLTAPITGIVSERFAQPGEKLPVDGRIVSIVDLSRMELEAEVPASDIGAIKPGARVEFSVDGLDVKGFEGRVERINPSADDRSRMIKVYAVLSNPKGELRGGMFAKGTLASGVSQQALIVPLSAIRDESGEEIVYVLNGDTVARHVVRVGSRHPARGIAELTEGPPVGTRVVNANLSNLKPGDRVKIAGATSR
ncbi:MAG: efflux RND transporter periplasmic adaptor subunit [Burkholderiales bacterium]|nr:efflux RND transporter periplasmic adaptor subunit [Burkholderiales bacterium]